DADAAQGPLIERGQNAHRGPPLLPRPVGLPAPDQPCLQRGAGGGMTSGASNMRRSHEPLLQFFTFVQFLTPFPHDKHARYAGTARLGALCTGPHDSLLSGALTAPCHGGVTSVTP